MHKPAAGVAWITGGGTGIGRGLALRLAEDGWKVAISGRRPGPLAETARLNPDHLIAYPLDVADLQAVRDTAAHIESELGAISLVIFNAGIGQFVKLSQLAPEISARHMQINYLGTVNGIDAILPSFLRRQNGHIVIVASVAGYRGVPLAAAYGPTKAALINLAEILHLELERKGIAVSVCNPGFIDTDMTRDNPFPMPFLMPLDSAVDVIYRGIHKRKFEITCPRRMIALLKIMRCLPYAWYFFLMKTFYSR